MCWEGGLISVGADRERESNDQLATLALTFPHNTHWCWVTVFTRISFCVSDGPTGPHGATYCNAALYCMLSNLISQSPKNIKCQAEDNMSLPSRIWIKDMLQKYVNYQTEISKNIQKSETSMLIFSVPDLLPYPAVCLVGRPVFSRLYRRSRLDIWRELGCRDYRCQSRLSSSLISLSLFPNWAVQQELFA